MADVFISYSRKDRDLMQRLHTSLVAQQRDVWVDWEDIPLTADWWQEIASGIESADTFVFIISPDSLASPICQFEIAHATEHHKRLVPVVYRQADEKTMLDSLIARDLDANARATLAGRDLRQLAQQNWQALSRHNWLFFGDDADFDQSFQQLVTAIDTDIAYVREHTRLLVRAREWESKGRDSSFLLRGTEIAEAESWLAHGVSKHPSPSEQHAEYITASRAAEARRQRSRLIATTAAMMVMTGLALVSALLFATADSARREADEQRQVADQQRATAESRGTEVAQEKATSEAALYEALNAQTLRLVGMSQQELRSGSARTALLLALESLAYRDQGIYHIASQTALSSALNTRTRELAELTHPGAVTFVSWNELKTRIVSGDDRGGASLWDAEGHLLAALPHDLPLRLGAWSKDGERLATVSGDSADCQVDCRHELRLFDGDGTLLNVFKDDKRFGGMAWNEAGTRLLTWSNTRQDCGANCYFEVQLRDRDGTALHTLRYEEFVHSAAWNQDGSRFVTLGIEFESKLWDSEGRLLTLLRYGVDRVYSARWSQNGAHLLTWGDGDTAHLRDRDGAVWQTFRHGQTLVDGSISPDGRFVITAGTDGSVKVWQAASGALLDDIRLVDARMTGAVWAENSPRYVLRLSDSTAELRTVASPAVIVFKHDNDVLGAAWDDAESRILTWSEDGTARVWADSGALLATLTHTREVRYAGWGSDATVLTRSQDGTARLWTLTARPALALEGQSSEDTSASEPWNKARTRLLTVSGSAAHLWQTDGTLVAVLPHDSPVQKANWAQEDQQIVTLANAAPDCIQACRYQFGVWTANGERVALLDHDLPVDGGMVSASGRMITAAGSGPGCADCRYEARLWDADGTLIAALEHQTPVVFAAWNAAGSRAVTLDASGRAQVWDAAGQPLAALRHRDPVLLADWNKPGTRLLSLANTYADPTLWDTDGQLLAALPLHEGATLLTLAWNEPGSRLLLRADDNTAALFDTDGALLSTLAGENEGVVFARWNEDGTRLLTRSDGSTARLWDADGQLLAVFDHGDRLAFADWDASGQRVVTRSSDSAKVWALDGRLLATMSGITRVGISEGGLKLLGIVGSGANEQMRLWDVATDAPVAELPHGGEALARLVWSADSARLLTVTRDNVLRWWDTADGRLLLRFDLNADPQRVAVSADGTRLLVRGADRLVWALPTDLDTILAAAQPFAQRGLTNPERERFFLPTVIPTMIP